MRMSRDFLWWKEPICVDIAPFEVKEDEVTRNSLDGPLGDGSNGTVYEVTARSLTVAAKVHFGFNEKSFLYDRQWVEKFAADVDAELRRVTAMPPQANILAPIGVVRSTFQREGEAPIYGIPKLVLFEKCERTLQDLLNRPMTTLTEEESITVLQHIGLAIDHAHKHNVAHCDIKPANILVLRGRFVLGDFGESTNAERTTMRPASGTPLYMAPDMCPDGAGERSRWGRAVDWWSFGVVCLALIDKCYFKNQRRLVDRLYNEGKKKEFQNVIDEFFANEIAIPNSPVVACAKLYLVIDPQLRRREAPLLD